MTKVPDCKFLTAIKQVGFLWLTMFFVLVCLGFCLLLLVLLGGTAWKIWEAITGVITLHGAARLVFIVLCFIFVTAFYAGAGSLAFFSAARGFLLKNTSLSWKQKEKIEGWASLVGALAPVILFLWIGLKAVLEGKI